MPQLYCTLKRPANASTTKAAMKESKIPKIPASRSGANSNKSNVLSVQATPGIIRMIKQSKKSDSTKENQEVDGGKGFQECGEPHKVENIKSLEFQNKENVPNVTSNIYKSSGSENLSSNGPPHESLEQAYECASHDQLSDKIQVEDIQGHFLDTASLSECRDNKLHTLGLRSQANAALFTSADIVPAVENHKYYIDTQFRVYLSLAKSKDHTTGTVTICNPMALCSLIKEEAIGANGLKNNILAEKAETKVSSDKPLKETQNKDERWHFRWGEEISWRIPHCISWKHCGPMNSHCLKVVVDDGQSGGLPEPQTPSLVVDYVFQEKHCMYLNNHLLLGKSTSSEELQEEKVLANVQVAHDQSDVDRSESKSSIGVIQVPLSMQDSGADIEGMAEHELVEDAPSGSVYTETSNEYDKSSIDTLFCMSEESVFLVQKEIQANKTNIVDIGIDNMNTIMPDDIGVIVSQANVGPSGELLHKLENTVCLAEDEDTAMPIKNSEDHGKQNSLIIHPRIYAVPFSDEWLAAVEAAREEILTMKSGAVQNSPPDKSLPEPGPWSPV
ncbi:hypothetical protein Acr_28g0012120 [Actinidia rufa]|uniref:Uncharacterized protein n=1 Tax=Actinidia rufa TaxID=165716 RepID=A0A7J0HBM3_9ERIC|nr:hypothetical protein Acr_28g0012120 [Actinidia rufa]